MNCNANYSLATGLLILYNPSLIDVSLFFIPTKYPQIKHNQRVDILPFFWLKINIKFIVF